MCNLNQVFRGMQKHHYSCSRRRIHQIVATPCCYSGQNRTTEESIEMCCPRSSPSITGTDQIPAVEKTLTGKQLPRKSPSSKMPDPSKTNPLSKRASPTTSQQKNKNKSSDSSVSSMNKKLSKGLPAKTNLSHKVSVNNSVKIERLSGGSVKVKKNQKSCVCTICEEDSLLSRNSSDHDSGSPSPTLSPKPKRKCKKMKLFKSSQEPQDMDLKAIVSTKSKRKKPAHRRLSSGSPISAIEGPNLQQFTDDDGMWFECNLPFRVNIPFPINIRSLFGLQSFQNSTCQCKAFSPGRNCGSPFCSTMRNALPAPVPEPLLATTRKGLRRFRKGPSPCPCETSTQTGEDESDLFRCLCEIKHQLATKSPECRCFAEKSTNVRTLEGQKKESKGAKISKESSVTSDESSASSSSLGAVRTPTTKNKKSEKKPKKMESFTSMTSITRNNSSKSSLDEVPKPPLKTKKTEKKHKKTEPDTSTSLPIKNSSNSPLDVIVTPQTKTKKTENKHKEIRSATSPSVRRKNSSNAVQKPPTKSKKTEKNSQKTQSVASTASVTSNSSNSSLDDVPKPPPKTKKSEQEPLETMSISSTTSSSCSSLNEVQEPPIRTDKSAEKPKKPKSTSTSVSKKSSLTSSKKVEQDSKKKLKEKEKGHHIKKPKVKNIKKIYSPGSAAKVEKKWNKPQVKENTAMQIQKEPEWTSPDQSNACSRCPWVSQNKCATCHWRQGTENSCPWALPNECSMGQWEQGGVESIKDEDIEKKLDSLDPESKAEKKKLKTYVEENKSKQIRKERKLFNPEPSIACWRCPRVFPNKCAMCQWRQGTNYRYHCAFPNEFPMCQWGQGAVESIEAKAIEQKHNSFRPESKEEKRRIKPHVEKKKSKQMQKERELSNPESSIACSRCPRVFPNECGMCQWRLGTDRRGPCAFPNECAMCQLGQGTEESNKDKDIEQKHNSLRPESMVENKEIKPQIEEKKSKQIQKERELTNPEPPIACSRCPWGFPNKCGMCQWRQGTDRRCPSAFSNECAMCQLGQSPEESNKNKDIEQKHDSLGPESKVENKKIEPQVEENKFTEIQKERELTNPEPSIACFSNECAMGQLGQEAGESIKGNIENKHELLDAESKVEKKEIKPQVEENKYTQIQEERELTNPEPPIACCRYPWVYPYNCSMCQWRRGTHRHCPWAFSNACAMCQLGQGTGESIKGKNIEINHDPLGAVPKVQKKEIKPQVEENKSTQIQKERELTNPKPGESIKGKNIKKEYDSLGPEPKAEKKQMNSYVEENKSKQIMNAVTPQMYQTPQCSGYQNSGLIYQRNSCLRNNTPETASLLQRKISSAATPVESKPLAEVMECEKIEPVRKPSVGFCRRPQIFREYDCPVTQGSECQSICPSQRRTSSNCAEQCQTQKPAIPISSSTEYNKKALLKKSLCRNTSPRGSLSSNPPTVFPRSPGIRCNRSMNCKPSAKSISFKECTSQSEGCNTAGKNKTSRRRKDQRLLCERISSGGETIGIEESQFRGVSREKKSVSRSILKNRSDQEYYFPLSESQQEDRSLNQSDMIYRQVERPKEHRSLSHKEVINNNTRQSKSIRGSGKKREVCVKDNISYNQNKSQGGISDAQIIVSFTNKSFSINSEEFTRVAKKENKKLSLETTNVIKTHEDLASQCLEKPFSKDHRLRESSRTDQDEDIDEVHSKSLKSSEVFESRLIYGQFKRHSSTERLRLNQVSENKTNIPPTSEEGNPKHQSMQCTRHVSGMSRLSNMSEIQTEIRQKSPTVYTNPAVNNRKRSCSAPGCCGASVLHDDENRSETPVVYRQCFSPRNQIPSKIYALTQGTNNIQDEIKQTEHIPICPKNNIKARIMQAKQRGACRCFIPRQDLVGTHTVPRCLPDYQNIPPRRQTPPTRIAPSPMKNRPTINNCKPKECYDESNKSYKLPEVGCQPRGSPYHQNTRCPQMGNPHNKVMPKMRLVKPTSSISFHPSQKKYTQPSDHSSSRPNTAQCQKCGKRNQRDTSQKNRPILKTRLRKPCSRDSLSQSEDAYYPRTCKCMPKAYRGKPNSTSASSSHCPGTESSISVECKGISSFSSSYNNQAKKTPHICPGNRNKPCFVHGNNSQILSSRSELVKETSDSELTEISSTTSNEETEGSSYVEPCKPKNTYSKSNQSGRTTDVETLETVTLMQPRLLRKNESTMIWNPDIVAGNTVLLEIRTNCKKDNLLQACARPPCNCCREYNTPKFYPPKGSSFQDSYLIDPRNHWSAIRSPAEAPGPSCPHQLQMHHPGFHPHLVKDAIEDLPIGFYDQTIQQYNIIRMDSDFQPPPLGPEVIQAVQALHQSRVCPYGNPIPQQRMRPVQDVSRPFFPPDNQIQHRLPMEPPKFCSRQPQHPNYQ